MGAGRQWPPRRRSCAQGAGNRVRAQPFPALGKFGSALPTTSGTALICTEGDCSPLPKRLLRGTLGVTGFSLMKNDNLVRRAEGSKHHPACAPM